MINFRKRLSCLFLKRHTDELIGSDGCALFRYLKGVLTVGLFGKDKSDGQLDIKILYALPKNGYCGVILTTNILISSSKSRA